MIKVTRALPPLGGTLALSTLVNLGLFIAGAIWGVSLSYGYLVWNLFLAWLPLVFMALLLGQLKRRRWSSWPGIGLSLLWLSFLPNSFYIVSDFIHLQEAPKNEILYNAVLFTSFALNGLILGFVSLYLFHMELRKRLPSRTTRGVIAAILLLCSFAIYLGRDLRWNTWDVLVNPAGILLDLSNRFISPLSYPRMFITTGVFFVLLTTTYYVVWDIARTLRRQPSS
jgi:uncharacterized membrane protein